jgi:hypothetical protein
MPRTFAAPQDFATGPRPAITLITLPEERSDQLAAVGYCDETKTLAVQFKRGAKAIYHYAPIERDGADPSYVRFMTSESMGKYHGEHLKVLTFDKYPADSVSAA